MIVVDVRKKANNDDLIYFPFVKKRIKGFYEDGKKVLLIRTIKMPKNIRNINENLTKCRYEEKDIMEHIWFGLIVFLINESNSIDLYFIITP